MRILHLLLAAALALSAGCTTNNESGDDGNGTGPDGDGAGAATNTTTSIPMNFQAAGPGPLTPSGAGTIEVPPNATAILVEARWDCTSPTCDITIRLLDPEGNEAGTTSGNGDATLTVESPANGTYELVFSTQAPTLQVTGEARATVFTGTMPSDFSAWDEEA